MTATRMMTTWVIGATIFFFLLVTLATARRMHAVRARARLPKRYRHLRALEHSIGWPRACVTLGATACALWLAWSMPDHAGVFLAPTLWAGLTTIGLIGIDQLVLGRMPRLDQWQPPTKIHTCFSWKQIALIIVTAGVLIYTIRWASQVATTDGTRVFGAWTIDGVAHWGWSDPFPGAHYTNPLKWMLPVLLVLTFIGAVATLARHTYRPNTRYTALDRGFRRRTISDLMLALIGALVGTLATISLTIAWAYATLGPGTPDNAAIVGITAVVGLCATGLSFWVVANLIFLPVVTEDKTIARMYLRATPATAPALVEPGVVDTSAIALVDAALTAGAHEDDILEAVSSSRIGPSQGRQTTRGSDPVETRRVIALGPGPVGLAETTTDTTPPASETTGADGVTTTVETVETVGSDTLGVDTGAISTTGDAVPTAPSPSSADSVTPSSDTLAWPGTAVTKPSPHPGEETRPESGTKTCPHPAKKTRPESGTAASGQHPVEETAKKTSRAAKATQHKKTGQNKGSKGGTGAKTTNPAHSSTRHLPPVKKNQPSSKHKPTAPAKQNSRTKQTTTQHPSTAGATPAPKQTPVPKQTAKAQQRSAKQEPAAKKSTAASTPPSPRGTRSSASSTRSHRTQSKHR